MIPTPKLGHLSAQDWEHVYEPAEDTFILLDALENDAEDLKKMGALTCLEVGSGSGCVSAFLGSILGASNAFYLCTDINSRAVDATLRTGVHNNVPLSPVLTSLTQSLLPRLKSKVDILLFNPPYVPTEHEELASAQVDSGISGAWAGGSDGMELTNLLLDNVGDLLSETGRFYLVGVKQNEPEGIKRRMFEGFGLYGECCKEEQVEKTFLYFASSDEARRQAEYIYSPTQFSVKDFRALDVLSRAGNASYYVLRWSDSLPLAASSPYRTVADFHPP